MRINHILLSAALAVSSVANAEIEKLVMPADKGISYHWWPKLSLVDGWHQDRESSLLYGINALVPDGTSFKDADAVIYAKAIYKPLVPDTRNLAALIEKEQKEFIANVPNGVIRELPELLTADGQKLKSFSYFSKDEGLWERVSYGEEGDFFLNFTMSSSSPAAFISTTGTYEKLIGSYRK